MIDYHLSHEEYWSSPQAHDRYWGEGHLDPSYEPNDEGYYEPEIDCYSLGNVASLKRTASWFTKEFAVRWSMWRGNTALDQRLATGRHTISPVAQVTIGVMGDNAPCSICLYLPIGRKKE
jgi:hypothetical protein